MNGGGGEGKPGTWNQAGHGEQMGWGWWGLVLLPRGFLSLPYPALPGFTGSVEAGPPRSPGLLS